MANNIDLCIHGINIKYCAKCKRFITKCLVCDKPTDRKVRSLNATGAHFDKRDGWYLCGSECEAKYVDRLLKISHDDA